jgi:segregation and condensation protein B
MSEEPDVVEEQEEAEAPEAAAEGPEAEAPEAAPAEQAEAAAEPDEHAEATEDAEQPNGTGPTGEELERILEALIFLSSDPVPVETLAEASEADEVAVAEAVAALLQRYAPGERGITLREVAGGLTFATDPIAEDAALRLLAKPRMPPLTPAQAETLAIVAYLQPVSRPEIARIRGVSSESATATLHERGIIEESGRSQFGAVQYRTTPLFLKLFGLQALDDLPDPSQWDPSPDEQAELRDRLMRAGEARAGEGPQPE